MEKYDNATIKKVRDTSRAYLRKKTQELRILDRSISYEDIAQKVAISFVNSDYNPERPLGPYVRRMTHNAVIDEMRRFKMVTETNVDVNGNCNRTSRPFMTTFDPTDACTKETNVPFEQDDPGYQSSRNTISKGDCERLLAILPTRQREATEFFFGIGDSDKEYTTVEIAKILGVTRQTVSSDLKKALATMRKHICM